MSDNLQLIHPHESQHQALSALFQRIVVRNDWMNFGYKYYNSSTKFGKELAEELGMTIKGVCQQDGSGTDVVLADNTAVVMLHDYTLSKQVTLAASTEERAQGVMAKILKLFPEDKPDEHHLQVTFWHHERDRGPQRTLRQIEIPHWEEIAGNYTGGTKSGLEFLMDQDPDKLNGQLVLWHGEPGTGKTYALRALGHRWKEKVSFNYVMDPEIFFGNSGYMMHVLMRSNAVEGGYQLVVLEDAGELLTADAKERVGQALSRLLNAVDGIFGQGLKVIILVTTNEKLGTLNPAVSRKGRCAAICEFEKFSPDEVDAWLEKHDLDPQYKSLTLAEMYALTQDQTAPEVPKRVVGFANGR